MSDNKIHDNELIAPYVNAYMMKLQQDFDKENFCQACAFEHVVRMSFHIWVRIHLNTVDEESTSITHAELLKFFGVVANEFETIFPELEAKNSLDIDRIIQ